MIIYAVSKHAVNKPSNQIKLSMVVFGDFKGGKMENKYIFHGHIQGLS